MLLATQAMPQMRTYAHPQLGRLLTPRHCTSLPAMLEAGVPWAVDNDCFNGGLDVRAWNRTLDRLRDLGHGNTPAGCLFVTCPDVVGDAAGTARQWLRWSEGIRRRGLPVAFVAQDGLRPGLDPPTWAYDALFIGGSTTFKLGPYTERLAHAAKDAGLWVHMGRVNSLARMAYAHRIDGTQWVRWRDRYLRWGLDFLAATARNGHQLSLLGR